MTTTTLPQPPSPRPERDHSAGRPRHRSAPVPLWWRDLSAGLGWFLVLFVVALWVAGGGLTAFGSVGQALTNVGRLTGLLASVLLLIQVFLIARVPFVEQSWGQDELVRAHRIVGFSSFTLMVAHVVLTTAGYNAGTGLGFVGTFVDEVIHSPGMLLALAGTVALGLVVVTSLRRARARLRYESWHLLHLYAYLGAGLALPHQLWTGADFLDSPVATAFWWGAYAASLVAVISFRVVVPLVRTRRHQLVVADVVAESPDVTSVVMTGRRLDRLPVRAGQFFTWRFRDGHGWTRGNPYSLSAAPDGRSLRITAAADGDGSSRLAELDAGTRVLIEGPYGRLHAGVRTRERSLLIGAGIGIAPLRALLEDLPGGSDTVLVYRVGSEQDLVLRQELVDLAVAKSARVVTVVGHRVPGRTTWLPAQASHLDDAEALRQLVPDVADRDVFVCGAPQWMDAVVAAARQCGVPGTSVHRERFAW